ncbi:hypothetical protein EJ110_NYTH49802 [Nymphaea thermarum]|nr:hypothetical protein EJ110_NYTH49802 [Nymphaea thermarum]
MPSFDSSYSSSPKVSDRRWWWMTNRKVAEKNMKEARLMLTSPDQAQRQAALALLDDAIAVCPRWDAPLHLKATALLSLRRYRDVAELFRDDIPSAGARDDSASSSCSSLSSDSLSRESLNLLPAPPENSAAEALTRCFSVSDIKHRFLPGMSPGRRNAGRRQHWRYIILGQALSHLGLLEDALLLLQAGKRLASAASRRDSGLFSDDVFSAGSGDAEELESVGQLLANVKFLLRRRAAALAALDAGIPGEAVRHFSKIIDGSRRAVPQAFLAECYMHRAAAYQAAGRISESIADCNRTLALDPTCVGALSTRASLLQSVGCFTECLQDLEHLKLLYDSILRDRRLPGRPWRLGGRAHFASGDVFSNSKSIAGKIAEMNLIVVAGSLPPVDYYALLGLRRGCPRSELECTHRLLCLRHRPDRATGFIERCEFADERNADGVRDQARMSAMLLYRLLQKAYAHVMATIMEEEAAERQQQKAAAAASGDATVRTSDRGSNGSNQEVMNCSSRANVKEELVEKAAVPTVAIFPGGFCREIAGVGSLLSPGFAHPAHHLHEALSC